MQHANPDTAAPERAEEAVHALYDTRLPQLSRWRRMQIPLISSVVYWILRGLGPTLEYEWLGWQHVARCYATGQRIIYAFWHRAILSAAWNFRHNGIVVLNTTNFDGQWTRRVIERFGYGTAQGSSSRGGLKGLAVMARRLEEGRDAAFTIDGPRGPRFVAKPGPVLLARRTGCPIIAFHCGLEKAYTFEKSWDLLQVPHPFSRGVVVIAPPIRVPQDASREMVEQKHAEMQAALDRTREVAESWFRLPPEAREALRHEWNEGIHFATREIPPPRSPAAGD